MNRSCSLSSSVREIAPLAPILLLACLGALPASAQKSERGDSSGAYVRVSREEMRVYFPPETSSAWGAPGAIRSDDGKTLRWIAMPEGVKGTASLSLSFQLDTGSHTAPSLETIVREGRRRFCRSDMVSGRCSSTDVGVSLENRRIVLSYRDTLEIRQMFGPRPAAVPLFRYTPTSLGDFFLEAAPVLYVDPPIVVDSAQRVALIEGRHQREASINRYYRSIAGGSAHRRLWLVVGDSVALSIEESECHIDLCSGDSYLGREQFNWGRWSLSDSSVATLRAWRPAGADTLEDYFRGRAMTLVAVRAGTSTVRVTGVHTPADTMPSMTAVDTILERQLFVTRPVGSVLIAPRPTTMVAGSPVVFTVHVLDRGGRTVEEAPVELNWDDNSRSVTSSEPITVTFTQPGRHHIVASLGAYTDSVMVEVRSPSSSP